MYLEKRGGVWWFDFRFGGRRYRRSTHVHNKNEAREIASAFRTALAKGEVGIIERKPIPGFKAEMDGFLKWSAEEHQTHPATHRRYQVSSIALIQYFKDTPLDQITPEAVELYKVHRLNQFKTVRAKEGRKRTKEKIHPATVNREMRCLGAMFKHAIKADLPLRNPVSLVRSLAEDNQQTRVLSYDEQEKYLNAATPLLRDIATIMLETGMRPEEVYRIQPENVHLSEGYLLNPYGKTKAARRRISLTAKGRGVIECRMKGCGTYLFPCETDSSRPVPKVNNAHDRAVKASGVARFRLYDLRHTWATRAAESGIDLVTLAAMLGHSKIQMVTRYAHPTQDHQAKAMERFEKFTAHQQIEAAASLHGISELPVQ